MKVTNPIYIFLPLLYFLVFPAIGEDESETNQVLQIEPETELTTAAFEINKEKGTSQESEQDNKKRSKIGIGETITLTLTGKPKGTISELKWEVEGKGLTTSDSKEGTESIKLTADKELMEGKSVSVSVTTSLGDKVPITVTIVVPSSISSEVETGIFQGSDGKDIDTSKYGIPSGFHGSLGFIRCTVQPTDVNFDNINAIERDGGLSWPGKEQGAVKPTLAGGHAGNGCDNLIAIDTKNQFRDIVLDSHENLNGIVNAIVSSGINPQIFSWLCHYKVHGGTGGPNTENKDYAPIDDTVQEFTFRAFGNNTETTIKKFGRTFRRNSLDEIQHRN